MLASLGTIFTQTTCICCMHVASQTISVLTCTVVWILLSTVHCLTWCVLSSADIIYWLTSESVGGWLTEWLIDRAHTTDCRLTKFDLHRSSFKGSISRATTAWWCACKLLLLSPAFFCSALDLRSVFVCFSASSSPIWCRAPSLRCVARLSVPSTICESC